MKLVTIQEFQTNFDQLSQACQQERVVVTVQGEPRFELSPYDPEDEHFMDDLIEHNAEFRAMMESRRNDRLISAEEVLKRLDDD